MVISREEVLQSLGRFRKGFLQILILFVLLGMIIYLFFSKALMRHLRDTSLQIDLVAFGIPESFLALLEVDHLCKPVFLHSPDLLSSLEGLRPYVPEKRA